jgi:hypothetical protein
MKFRRLRRKEGGERGVTGQLPLAAIHQFIPFGNFIAQRTTRVRLVAKGYAAIHATRRLRGGFDRLSKIEKKLNRKIKS